MEPKEKANELVNKMLDFTDWHDEDAKQCALIAVNIVLNENLELPDLPETIVRYLYWQEVKQKIEKL